MRASKASQFSSGDRLLVSQRRRPTLPRQRNWTGTGSVPGETTRIQTLRKSFRSYARNHVSPADSVSACST